MSDDVQLVSNSKIKENDHVVVKPNRPARTISTSSGGGDSLKKEDKFSLSRQTSRTIVQFNLDEVKEEEECRRKKMEGNG